MASHARRFALAALALLPLGGCIIVAEDDRPVLVTHGGPYAGPNASLIYAAANNGHSSDKAAALTQLASNPSLTSADYDAIIDATGRASMHAADRAAVFHALADNPSLNETNRSNLAAWTGRASLHSSDRGAILNKLVKRVNEAPRDQPEVAGGSNEPAAGTLLHAAD